jgi:hypothetical protein
MQKIIFAVALAAFGLVAGEALAVTVLNTTQESVKGQCAGKTKCSAACGSTLCDYVCEDPKKQCTVAIFLKKPKGGHVTRPTTGPNRAR